MPPQSRRPASFLPLTPAVFHILLALADGPLHGYAIMQGVERSAGPALRMGPGTIYGTIQRLEESGLLAEHRAKRSDRRRVYGLLPLGREVLEAESARLSRLARMVRAKKLVTGEV